MHAQAERLQRLAQALHDQVKRWRLQPVVKALQALRGVPCTVAITRIAAVGDLTRVDTHRELMKCLGLIPSEYSSGERRRQGSITQAGHTHARRALVEGAWASRSPAQGSRHLHLRLATQPQMIQDMSWQAHVRLCQRYRQWVARGTHTHVVTVAMARELAGFMWAMAKQLPVVASVNRSAGPGTLNAEGCRRASEEAQPRCGVTLGGVMRLVGKDTRAESEAGTRRTHGRWEPTPGEQQDQPSLLTGSDSSDAPR